VQRAICDIKGFAKKYIRRGNAVALSREKGWCRSELMPPEISGARQRHRDTRLFVHAIWRAPAALDLNKSFYSEPDDRVCFFDTTYSSQSYTDQHR
jgi:hypothetical protein